MHSLIQKFISDQTGATTVDWVVLSAAVIGMGMVILTPIAFSADSVADDLAGDIRNIDLPFDLD